MLRILGVVVLTVTAALPSIGQQSAADRYLLRPSMVQGSDGSSRITAISPRPLEQAVAGLRKSGGWVVDYEDPQYDESEMTRATDGKLRLIGGRFTASILMAERNSQSQERSAVTTLVSQYNRQQSEHKFRVVQSGLARFDVVPDDRGREALLDTPIQLVAGHRSLEETIDAILAAVSNKRGVMIERGGLIDGDLMRTEISLSAGSAVPARELLAQTLAQAHFPRIWVLTHEASDGKFYIGIQTIPASLNTAPVTPANPVPAAIGADRSVARP